MHQDKLISPSSSSQACSRWCSSRAIVATEACEVVAKPWAHTAQPCPQFATTARQQDCKVGAFSRHHPCPCRATGSPGMCAGGFASRHRRAFRTSCAGRVGAGNLAFAQLHGTPIAAGHGKSSAIVRRLSRIDCSLSSPRVLSMQSPCRAEADSQVKDLQAQGVQRSSCDRPAHACGHHREDIDIHKLW